jgi:hypothetical protein
VNLIDPIELRGSWKLLGESETHEAGVLSLVPATGAELKVHRAGRFSDTLRMFFGRQAADLTVTGYLADGRSVVLHQCLLGQTQAAAAASVICLRPQLIRIGTAETARNKKNIAAMRLTLPITERGLKVPGIYDRLRQSKFHDDGTPPALYSFEKELFCSSAMRIGLISQLSGKLGNEIRFSANDIFELSFWDTIDQESALSVSRRLTDFFSLFVGEWVSQSKMQVKETDTWVDIWFQHAFLEHASAQNVPAQKSYPIELARFSALYSRWLELYDDMERALSLTRVSHSKNVTMIDVRFLLAVQALETVHRSMYGG